MHGVDLKVHDLEEFSSNPHPKAFLSYSFFHFLHTYNDVALLLVKSRLNLPAFFFLCHENIRVSQ